MTEPLHALTDGLNALDAWRSRWPAFAPDATLELPPETMAGVLAQLAERLQDNFPFHHPLYAGQMLKPPHPLAWAAYAMTMTINPNNHALDGGPATAKMELEAIADMARLFGFTNHLGHLTASGTIANLEALWVARQLHPDKGIACSIDAHYTHPRMAAVLGMTAETIPTDAQGRLDLAAVESVLASGRIGTLVVTPGTTGLGAVDPIHELVPIARRHGVRVHVDAAYGGFYRVLTDAPQPMIDVAPWLAIAECDSVVVDPHKHGLQPYGCGCVLFRDPSVGRFYKHDSPYTYFTSNDLHLGEISLECSRAGAAAAAFWATLQAFPLRHDAGFGPILGRTRQAALDWAERLSTSPDFRLVVSPELDIVAFFPVTAGLSASRISAHTEAIFQRLETHPEQPVYLAKLQVRRELLATRYPDLHWDQETVTVLRSCLMKPEQASFVGFLHQAVTAASQATARDL